MKAAKEWKSLTQTQRRAWSAWAKNNPVLLADGTVRRVSGRKAMTRVLRNRALAGDAANPAVLPGEATWSDGGLSLRDAGPFTENAGFVGFRAEDNFGPGVKWLVWATRPLGAEEVNAHGWLRFIAVMTPGTLVMGDLTPSIGTAYAAVHGSWDGPGEGGEWPVDTFIWLRVHHYVEGQLSPGVMMQGRIQVEL
ncbi:MAG TPA: hypothetical protein PKO21_04735 [Verrucomicrobiota bacterium]|nr:hypothetical protein [Verrucomicrobiota bacterium]